MFGAMMLIIHTDNVIYDIILTVLSISHEDGCRCISAGKKMKAYKKRCAKKVILIGWSQNRYALNMEIKIPINMNIHIQLYLLKYLVGKLYFPLYI